LYSAEIGTADGATGSAPPGWNEECETRPTCQSWRKITPPLAWTASTTSRQPSTCSANQTPGTSGLPTPLATTGDASAMINPPAVARWA
jgi:hypothetical protein